MPVSTHPESSRYLFHEVYAVLGRITVVDQFHLYGRRQSEIPEYCHIAGDSVQIVFPNLLRRLFFKPVGIDSEMR